jgi:cation diffusion facilitator CzcD-associated flavoprotein CzcO
MNDGIGAQGAPSSLRALEERVASDLARTAHPRMPWLEARIGPDGRPAHDVIIVGGGQSGLATAFGLMRSQVSNILVLDKAPEGLEGPWLTYARMPTLRSPKDFTGPDLDMPSLTYQSWHEACFGAESWQTLDLIATEAWADYLAWFRRVLSLPVCNEAQVVDIAPAGELLAVTVLRVGGAETLHARKIVLATGQEGMGRWAIPAPLSELPAARRASADATIDFAALRGKSLAVIGAGASAFDNAATALEAGAAEVHLLCRRPAPQLIQPYRWVTFRGFLRHVSDLDDAWRWRFMSTIQGLREGFPQATYDRCARHGNFRLHVGAPVEAAREIGDRIELTTPAAKLEVDFVICATGIEIDFSARPELRRFASNIATWGERYTPPEGEANPHLARFPYLARDHALCEGRAGLTPWIRNIHLFSIASTMSFGVSGSSINAMTTAVPKLVADLTSGLFIGDVDARWRSLLAYDVPQAILREGGGTGHG